jgi:hypothetical protein
MADPILKDEIFIILDKVDYDAAVKADILTEHKKLKSKNLVGYRWNVALTQVLLQISCTSDAWIRVKTYFAKVKKIILSTEIIEINKLLADALWVDNKFP